MTSDLIVFKSVSLGTGEVFLENIVDVGIREDVAKQNIDLLVGNVQPVIDQSIFTTESAVTGLSVVDGTYDMAILQMDHITTTTQIIQDTAHYKYTQLVFGRDINELFKDIADRMYNVEHESTILGHQYEPAEAAIPTRKKKKAVIPTLFE